MKKAIAAILVVIMVFVALPGGAAAEKTERTQVQQSVILEAESLYKKCLSTAQRKSFAGFCGLMTSHQLYNLGINESLIICDGNRQYDCYKNMDKTSGGYSVRAYPRAQYTLEQALNVISCSGKKDVYNLLVGFHRTNTEAGAKYGHAVFINAILDGTVYFVESFNYTFGSLDNKEGKTLTCSIKEFADYFDSWTSFEGIIYFGLKEYSARCQTFGTNVFLRARFDSSVRSQPCLVGENDCIKLRSIAAGEVLHTTAVCKNTQGELFYYIEDGEQSGYISANAVSFLQVNEEDLTLSDVKIPLTAKQGNEFNISGKITASYGSVSMVKVAVFDAQENVLLQAQLDTEGSSAELSILNEILQFASLADGSYRLRVYAVASNILVKEMGFTTEKTTVCLLEQSLVIGDGTPLEALEQASEDGWVWKDGTWYCYENGQPCTGWTSRFGVDHYLRDDGAVVTGWLDMEGWHRYFTSMGALCSGWITTGEGTYYWISDGVYATDWQTIDGSWYLFDENGLLIKEGTVEEAMQ